MTLGPRSHPNLFEDARGVRRFEGIVSNAFPEPGDAAVYVRTRRKLKAEVSICYDRVPAKKAERDDVCRALSAIRNAWSSRALFCLSFREGVIYSRG